LRRLPSVAVFIIASLKISQNHRYIKKRFDWQGKRTDLPLSNGSGTELSTFKKKAPNRKEGGL